MTTSSAGRHAAAQPVDDPFVAAVYLSISVTRGGEYVPLLGVKDRHSGRYTFTRLPTGHVRDASHEGLRQALKEGTIAAILDAESPLGLW